jgi:hypothetical protein
MEETKRVVTGSASRNGSGAAGRQRPSRRVGRRAVAAIGNRHSIEVGHIGLTRLAMVAFVMSTAFSLTLVLAGSALALLADHAGILKQLNALLGGLMTIDANSLIMVLIVIGVGLVVVNTLVGTLTGVLYNMTSALVGGVRLGVDDGD